MRSIMDLIRWLFWPLAAGIVFVNNISKPLRSWEAMPLIFMFAGVTLIWLLWLLFTAWQLEWWEWPIGTALVAGYLALGLSVFFYLNDL